MTEKVIHSSPYTDPKDVVIHELIKKVAVLESQTYYDDEQSVQDKATPFLHQPHVITAIFAVLGYLLYQTWTATSETSLEVNLKNGICAAIFFFMILGMMTFPTSGMFIIFNKIFNIKKYIFHKTTSYQLHKL